MQIRIQSKKNREYWQNVNYYFYACSGKFDEYSKESNVLLKSCFIVTLLIYFFLLEWITSHFLFENSTWSVGSWCLQSEHCRL